MDWARYYFEDLMIYLGIEKKAEHHVEPLLNPVTHDLQKESGMAIH